MSRFRLANPHVPTLMCAVVFAVGLIIAYHCVTNLKGR